jgi:glycine oxidase
MSDIIIAGGGVIGLSIAYELAGQGSAVVVLDQGPFAQESSWAGAGILPPGNLEFARTPEARLRALSHSLWPKWTAQLLDETGIDNGFRNCGGIEVRLHGSAEHLRDELDDWRREGVVVEELDSQQLARHEPQLNPAITAAYRLPQECQVRNPRHLKALLAACARRGVALMPGNSVVGFERDGERIIAARTARGVVAGGQFVVAGGAWSPQILSSLARKLAVDPVRGQIVQLATVGPPFRHVISCGPRYLVPRTDGRLLIGSTEEWVGFEKRNTAEAVAELIRFGMEVVPCLSSASFERSWSGLRPGSADGLPYLGRVPGFQNLVVAAGHFRSGLQMSPGTAVVARQILFDQETAIPIDALSMSRGLSLS